MATGSLVMGGFLAAGEGAGAAEGATALAAILAPEVVLPILALVAVGALVWSSSEVDSTSQPCDEESGESGADEEGGDDEGGENGEDGEDEEDGEDGKDDDEEDDDDDDEKNVTLPASASAPSAARGPGSAFDSPLSVPGRSPAYQVVEVNQNPVRANALTISRNTSRILVEVSMKAKFEERIVGYDAREFWRPFDWSEENRNRFLYRLDITKPLSVDVLIGNPIFASEGRSFHRSNSSDSRVFGPVSRSSARRSPSHIENYPFREFRMIAAVLVLGDVLRERANKLEWPRPPVTPDQRGPHWKLIGTMSRINGPSAAFPIAALFPDTTTLPPFANSGTARLNKWHDSSTSSTPPSSSSTNPTNA